VSSWESDGAKGTMGNRQRVTVPTSRRNNDEF